MTDGSETVSEPVAQQDTVSGVGAAVGAGAAATTEPAAAVAGTQVAPAAVVGDETASAAAAPAADATRAPAVEAAEEARAGGLEAKAAEQLHALVEKGADLIPGEQGGMVSRFAVALASFGSAMTEKGEKDTSALARDAVEVFKSLDGDADKQRAALETAISDLGNNLVGEEERGKVLDVAQQAMNLWKASGGGVAGAAGAAAAIAKSDSALSLRSLAGLLRGNGDEDGAAKSEQEADKLEGK